MGIYKLGSYVKMTIKGIKHKFIKNFTPDIPLILSRINPGEDQLGFVKLFFYIMT